MRNKLKMSLSLNEFEKLQLRVKGRQSHSKYIDVSKY